MLRETHLSLVITTAVSKFGRNDESALRFLDFRLSSCSPSVVARGELGDAVTGKENSHLRIVANADGAAILDTKAGSISTLNPTGAQVWQALERGEDLEAIAAGLARETGEHIAMVRKDLEDFIDALKRQNLLSC
jgi:hypothetical protein